ncbi:MAG TPA: hypothetical protein VHL58_01750 [Thermoanaerobaculia bacterium]|nr:hypothetical protein [Thermoanaerobaculia bacterium]
MTLYDENGFVFRPHPSVVALTAVSLFFHLLNLQLSSLLRNVCEQLTAHAVADTGRWVLYAPVADQTARFFHPGARPGLYAFNDLITIAAATVLGLGVIIFWPTEQSLASRLYVHSLALCLAAFTGFATAFDLNAAARIDEVIGVGRAPSMAILVVIGLATAMVIFFVERMSIALMSNMFPVSTPLYRLKLWLQRIAVPFGLIAAIALFNNDLRDALAAAAVILVTLLENLGHVPLERFEQLSDVHLREAAALAPVLVGILIAASIYLFGFPRAGLPHRVVAFDKRMHPSLVRLDQVGLQALDVRSTESGKTEPKKIDIRWSKKKRR